VDQLVDAVWDDGAPATASAQIRDRVRLLRRALALCPSVTCPKNVLTASGAGYRLLVAPGEMDLDRFESLAQVAVSHSIRAGAQTRRICWVRQ
jgi:DNA-binding SARP family transcriptional activator